MLDPSLAKEEVLRRRHHPVRRRFEVHSSPHGLSRLFDGAESFCDRLLPRRSDELFSSDYIRLGRPCFRAE